MFEQICRGVYLVGGGQYSDVRDCLVYAIDAGDLVLIDSGCGPGWWRIRDNLCEAGLDPARLHTLILTHCHVDHIGGATKIAEETRCRVIAHELDALAIGAGDRVKTAAGWYAITLPPTRVSLKVPGVDEVLHFARGDIRLIHTPGHTPGSMVALYETDGKKVLFGQDIHGPFEPDFGSDIGAWRDSMRRLLDLNADMLCEGHYGVFRGRDAVREFIERHLAAHAGKDRP
ncbi:MAG: MBL fold metallo-hydrolase [Deltaproteobacteria bacterium]|nr:MBL fold metallo-hydrolase [Deltaproteobacteria bacterium]